MARTHDDDRAPAAKSHAGKIMAGFAVLATLITGQCSYKIVPAQSYGVHIQAGQMKSDHVPPGFYGKWPIWDKYYIFNNNTIIMEVRAGTGGNTADQNSFSADLRLHFRVDPKVGLLALQVKKMASDNGKELVASFLNPSVDAVVGSRPVQDTLGDPSGFLKALMENFQWRLAQNNVPVRLDTIEMMAMNVGAGSDGRSNYGLRKPIQIRIRSNGVVEEMVGPAAVPVVRSGSQTPIVSPTATVLPQPNVEGPTTATAPVPDNPALMRPTVQPR